MFPHSQNYQPPPFKPKAYLPIFIMISGYLPASAQKCKMFLLN